MAQRFWVIGGEFTDTSFATFAAGKSEERLGPFDSLAEARNVWSARAWRTVDDCYSRYWIVMENPDVRLSKLKGTEKPLYNN